jgi:uncharacterized protein YifN (PemK superfamily)
MIRAGKHPLYNEHHYLFAATSTAVALTGKGIGLIKIVVEYRQVGTSALLGRVQYDDIEQALIPRMTGNATFCHRHFNGHHGQHWQVRSVGRTSANGVVPAVVTVELSRHSTETLEYLSDTLPRITGNVFHLIHPGTLVEVDYGFVQQIIDVNGNVIASDRYVDTHLSGEMHKRRLAIVTKVYKTTLQVAPITSKAGQPGDPTRVEVSAKTLSQLSFYGGSGLSSWALCGALEGVSFHRVLPPSSFYTKAGKKHVGRNTSYNVSISSAERRSLREAVMQAVGVSDYGKMRDDLAAAKQDLATREADLQEIQAQLTVVEAQNAQLRLVEEVAQGWQNQHHCKSLDEEVQFLVELYATVR